MEIERNNHCGATLTEGRLPALNDSGDMELMIYTVNDSHVLATAEGKWPSSPSEPVSRSGSAT